MKILLMALLTSVALHEASAADGQWLTDFATAKAKAKTENKMILMDFTGSDWCPPCKALSKNVLSSAEFIEYAKKNLVLMEIDFPTGKKQSDALKQANDELARKFSVGGYPTVVVLDSMGKELTRNSGYDGETPKEYIAKIEALKKN